MQTQVRIRQALSSLILFSSLLTGIISCDKKDHYQDTPAPAANRLQEYKNGDQFVRFDYNTNGTIRKVTMKNELTTNDNVIDYNITYNAAKKITLVQTSAGERMVPVYENNVLTRADIFEGTERTGFINYVFENNLLKRVTLYWGEGTDFMPFFELNHTHDNAGNTIETVALAATGPLQNRLDRLGHVKFLHDTKTNPLYEQKDLLELLLWQSVSQNNIRQEEHFDASLVLEDRYTYTYTYKSNGLPESAEVKNGLPGSTPATSRVDFIY
jgi:hypothetical protein